MNMTATARRVSTGLKYEVNVNKRHTVATDEPVSLGGTDEGPAPHELLPAALASCIATTVAMYAERHRWDIGESSVEVDYDTDASPRSFEIAVYLPDDLSAEQLQRLERVAKNCPLRRALEDGFSFEERQVPTPRPPRAA
jgi:putative redox protein